MNIRDYTIQSALKEMRAGTLRAKDLILSCLENIERYTETYNVLLSVAAKEDLLAEAKKIDSSGYDKPLSGIPIVLKDIFSTTSLRTTAGSKVLENYHAPYEATVVKKLREAGAIIIGKANQDAWAHGSTGENSDFGPTSSAYDIKYVAGGSSSGSATAVALGMCLASTGTDTGGSIRVPASFNNLVGLKPTYGRVSRYGIIAMASSLDSVGHMTKTVYDNALMLSVTAGIDPYDATTGQKSVSDYLSAISSLQSLKGITIGVSPDYLTVGKKATDGMNPELEKLTEEALGVFTALGATIKEIDLPHTKDALETYYVLCPSEVSSNLGRYDGIRYGNTRDAFGLEARRRIMIGTYTLSAGYYDAYYKTAQKVRTLVCQEFEKAFETVDVVFAPVSPSPSPLIGEFVNDPLALYLSDIYTVPVNLAGLAGLSLPAGFVGTLPVGIQLIGKQWSEERLYAISNVYEKKTEWYKRRPKV
ncbi:Asp-tRNA(Asn)/Glu-tRNA(Gln) amidotransferase subunit GatA [Candidatus Gottesmanbacteria bacterium]|nr:Asp-tRNA(Asn)/Glu-tRNA(Gln) amidotransferase subunit GatA [Candidatus Gottesmanbacteria bacterium]